MTCNAPITEGQVQEAFLAAPPLISSTIADLTVKTPIWGRDLYQVQEWPRGNGTLMEQIVFRGAMPQIERGFDAWAKQSNNTGCNPCDGPNCSYNWTPFGGNGFERKVTELMSREFRSPSYCVKEIQTTANFKEVFSKIVQNLYGQVDFFKEMNIGFNFLTSLAKKFVVDSSGARPNTANPYVYPNLGTARLSMLNIEMLEQFYEVMRRNPSAVPYDVVDGAPIYALEASHQLLARLYRDDQNLRQDVRFSGLANDLVGKYNFMSTIRGMFIAAPILYPRRFNVVNGNPVEVLPFVNGVPAEVGSYTANNPLYEAATHEEVIIHGKHPFSIFYMPTESTLGENSSFGPELSFMNSWMWVNPMTNDDPFRRSGFFATSAQIGLSQQYSEAIFAILVERPSRKLMAAWIAEPTCPPEPVSCDNTIPATGCPCPLVTGFYVDPFTGDYVISLGAPQTDLVVGEDVVFGLDNGGYVSGEIVAVTSDFKTVSVTLASDVPVDCNHFTTIYCSDTLACSANVLSQGTNGSSQAVLVLSAPIAAVTALDEVVVTYADGTTATVAIVSANVITNTFVLADTTGTQIVHVCVPTATAAGCPGCGVSSTQCS